MQSHRSLFGFGASLLIVSMLTGCQFAAGTPTDVPGNLATPTPVPTTEPTATPTPAPTATQTPLPTPTPNLTATAAAQATAAVEALMVDIRPALEKVKIQTDDGHLVWAGDEPRTLKVDSYDELNFDEIKGPGQLADFVLYTEITWNSSSGLAGCGIMFRSEEDFEKGAQYRLMLLRLQNAPAWGVDFYKHGQSQVYLNGDDIFSRFINDEQDSTNQITLVARGEEISLYVNDEKLRTMQSNSQMEGRTAFYTYQESGNTSCTFDHSWIWSLEE